MDATNELIEAQMDRVRDVIWQHNRTRVDYRAARRESGPKKQMMRARSKALMASIEEKLREEYVTLRDMLNAVLEEEA